jgi:hypothetical protein
MMQNVPNTLLHNILLRKCASIYFLSRAKNRGLVMSVVLLWGLNMALPYTMSGVPTWIDLYEN